MPKRRPFCTSVSTTAVAFMAGVCGADAPRQLLSSNVINDADWHAEPYRQFRAIGSYGSPLAQPILAVDAGGQPKIFLAFNSSDPIRSVPSSAAPCRELVAVSGLALSLREDTTIVQWGTTNSYRPLEAAWLDVDAGAFGLAGVTSEGVSHVWNAQGPHPTTAIETGAIGIELGANWGVVRRSDGRLTSFGYSSQSTAPEITLTEGAVSFTVSPVSPPTATNRSAAIMGDGSLRSLHGEFAVSDPAGFEAVDAGGTRLVALDGNGQLRWWQLEAGVWGATASTLPGRYDHVGADAAAGFHAIVSVDGDRDGVNDTIQISQGELPDVNGNLVNDTFEGTTTLRDMDRFYGSAGDGVPDDLQYPSMSPIHAGFGGGIWSILSSTGDSVAWLALDRVRWHGGVATDLAVVHGRACPLGGDGCFPETGIEAEYFLLLDPNGDGRLQDAVRLYTAPTHLNASGYTRFAMPPIALGPAGGLIAHGFRAVLPQPRLQTFMDGGPPPFPTADPFARSRVRGLHRYSGDTSPTADLSTLIRNNAPLSTIGTGADYYKLPFVSLSWGSRTPKDCDGDGLRDGDELGYPELNGDNDMILDACELDCNENLIADRDEISLLQAIDCDSNGVLDSCEAGGVLRKVQTLIPSPDNDAPITVQDLPPSMGDVRILVSARGDLGGGGESLTLAIGGGAPHELLFPAADCGLYFTTPIVIDATEFNALTRNGTLEMQLGASKAVDPAQCAENFARIQIDYIAAELSDCDANGVADRCELSPATDCDRNGRLDICDLLDASRDINMNGTLDTCEVDCDRDGLPDSYEIASTPSLDCDGNGWIDSCQLFALDCDSNGNFDTCDIQGGAADDDADGTLDVCERNYGDLDLSGRIDGADLAVLLLLWNTVDPPYADLNGDAIVNAADAALLLSRWGIVPDPQ
jgi:hypothetical protein